MRGMAASQASTPDSMYEAVRDEVRLIQDSLLPAGTLRGPGFEVAFRYKPLDEVGGDFVTRRLSVKPLRATCRA